MIYQFVGYINIFMARYNQGIFKPTNPSKYRGDVTKIVFRSSWEKRFFIWADTNPSVIFWSSEETIVPYVCGTDNKIHRYFVDVTMKIRDTNGNVSSYLVEIKPYAQTQPPKFKGRQTPRYLNEVETYVKNQSKWAAAKKYAEDRGAKFMVITEKELGIGK